MDESRQMKSISAYHETWIKLVNHMTTMQTHTLAVLNTLSMLKVQC